MKFRWTKRECEENSDYKMLIGLIAERTSDLNPYSHLAQRLNKIYGKLSEEKKLTK